MANIFNIDFSNVGENLVPHFWRKQKSGVENDLVAYIRSVLAPIQNVSDDLLTLQQNTKEFLDYNGQHAVLEEYLNDLYDVTLRRIYITENDLPSGAFNFDLYLQSETDLSPISIYLQNETNPGPFSLYLQGESPSEHHFTVNIPVAIIFNTNLITAQIQNYSIAGKLFNIVTF